MVTLFLSTANNDDWIAKTSGDVGSDRYCVGAVGVAVGSTTTFVPMGTWS
jgi:hypothetical protein